MSKSSRMMLTVILLILTVCLILFCTGTASSLIIMEYHGYGKTPWDYLR